MNIFASYSCPHKSARLLDNKRANKMIVESFQLMSNAIWINGSNGFYKKTHINHPCSIWTAQSRGNFLWVLKHATTLINLFKERYQHSHTCGQYIGRCQTFHDGYSWALDYRTPFVNCTDFKDIADVHLAYRLHLVRKWYKAGLVSIREGKVEDEDFFN